MRPDLQRLCNADHRTAEDWLRNALEKIGSDGQRNSFECNAAEKK